MVNILHRHLYSWWQQSALKRILQGEGPQRGPYALNRHRIFILPTRHGLLFAGTLLIMLLGAINYNNSLAYLLTFTLTSLSMVAILHTYRNLSGLVFRAGSSVPVFAGQQACFEIYIDHSGSDTRFAIQLRKQLDKQLNKQQRRQLHKQLHKQPLTTVDVQPQQSTTTQVSLPTHQRGIFRPGQLIIETRYPLGLFRAWSYLNLDMHTLVYPQPAAHGRLPPASPRRLASDGDQGRGADDFIGFRSYHPGDSLRHVHWKAVAREQGMYTKQFGGDRVEELWLEWEMAGDMDHESRLRQLCRWVIDAEMNEVRYGLHLPGTTLQPSLGAAHRHQCLETLAMFGISGKKTS